MGGGLEKVLHPLDASSPPARHVRRPRIPPVLLVLVVGVRGSAGSAVLQLGHSKGHEEAGEADVDVARVREAGVIVHDPRVSGGGR